MAFAVFAFLLSLAGLIMFIIMFVVVLKIWNFHQEVLKSGGYPTVTFSRSKQEATDFLNENIVLFPDQVNDIIAVLSRYPDDPEVTGLVQRLKAQQESLLKSQAEKQI